LPLAAGTRLGPYEILAPLGAGGMGEVYRARDARLLREVAVKVLPAELAQDPERLERFAREGRAAAALAHPNILAVHDLGSHEGTPFLVCELLAGETLRDRLRSGRVPLETALGWALQLARGIAAAHARGIVHRDLKPENVFLTGDGHLKILDFGLAKEVPAAGTGAGGGDDEATLSLTGAGTVMGSLGYMSPEQARGHTADHRADVFAFGAVAYEMACGERAFPGATAADALAAVLREEPRALVDGASAGLPPGLVRLLRRCLAKRPEDRYQSAGDLAFDLEALLTAPREPAAAAADEPLSIAVLPFADMSPGSDQDYFCDGMAEEILNALCCVPGLRVAARTSSFQFKNTALDVRMIGQRLGTTHMLEGSVRKAGDRLRITVQLVAVADGYHLWSERFDRQLADVFAVQDEIAKKVAAALRVVLSEPLRRQQQAAATRNVAAYDFYLRGRQFFYQYRRQAIEFAKQMFEQALALDAGYALAWAGLADCSTHMATWWGNDPAEVRRADEASRKAVELAPSLPEARAARGQALAAAGDLTGAREEFAKALRLNPNLFEALFFGAFTAYGQGLLEESLALYERAEAARPEDYQSPLRVAQLYAAIGQHEHALAAARRGVALARAHLDLHPDDSRAYYLAGNGLVRLGEREEGLRLAERALHIHPNEEAVLYNLACVYALAGETERALDCLDRAVERGFGNRHWLEIDPDLAALRGLERFGALIGRLA
jgi:non-specific serine/threonine protein kinase